ncbi:MAG: cupredoxin domain-containing protein [Euryarchaeota archaeon]|nr:cupredoxin domain-containing protein [Euryarchaeota archaeon]
MDKNKGTLVAFGAVAVVALLVGAFAFTTALGRTPAAAPTDRTIVMTAVEYKGTFGEGESQPAGTVVKAYRWDPSYIVVNKGDRVTLKVFGVNGDQHPSTIDGYDITFTVKRGEWTTVTFTASKAGTFEIVCHVPEHTETMHAYLYVVG